MQLMYSCILHAHFIFRVMGLVPHLFQLKGTIYSLTVLYVVYFMFYLGLVLLNFTKVYVKWGWGKSFSNNKK